MILVPKKSEYYSPLSLFDSALDRVFNSELNSKVLAPIDVFADEKNIYVKTELPGMSKKDIHIEYKDGVLHLSGEKKTEIKNEKEGAYYYCEIQKGSFNRSINVGDINFDHASAEYKDGILTITLPKSENQGTHRLEIQ